MFFKTYFYNKKFVDCLGKIFILKDKIRIKRRFRFPFLKNKYILIFQETNETFSFEELRAHMIEKLGNMEESKGKNVFYHKIKKAKDFHELFDDSNWE
jgi:hypothetical protein